MYGFNSRVRFSEVDENKRLTAEAAINYFQDCCMFHSMEAGIGLDYTEPRQECWMTASWQIIFDRYPVLGEKMHVSTWAYAFKGFFGYRNFSMEDESGHRVIYANSLWLYYDMKRNALMTVPKEQIEGYGLDPRLDMDYAPRKIRLPGEMQERPSFAVRHDHLDTNHHVNNAQYIRMALHEVPANFPLHELRVEYRKQAVLDDIIVPRVTTDGGKVVVALCEDTEKISPYAVIEAYVKE